MSKYIIAALALAFLVFVLIDGCSDKRRAKELTETRAALAACTNAPIRSDTVIRTERIQDTVYLYRKSQGSPVTITEIREVQVSDTTIKEQEYQGSWQTDRFAVRWTARVFGDLLELDILPDSEYTWPEIQTTKTVTLPFDPDQCPKEPKNRWTVMVGAGSDFKTVPLFEARLLFQRKALGVYTGGAIYEGRGLMTGGLAFRIR